MLLTVRIAETGLTEQVDVDIDDTMGSLWRRISAEVTGTGMFHLSLANTGDASADGGSGVDARDGSGSDTPLSELHITSDTEAVVSLAGYVHTPAVYPAADHITDIAVSAQIGCLAFVCGNGAIALFDTRSGEELCSTRVPRPASASGRCARCVAISPCGTLIYTSTDRSICTYRIVPDPYTLELADTSTLALRNFSIRDMAPSPSGAALYAAGASGVSAWGSSPEGLSYRTTLDDPTNPTAYLAVCVAPAGDVVYASGQGRVMVWDADSASLLHTIMQRRTSEVLCGTRFMGLSPCGSRLICVANERAVVWGTSDMAPVAEGVVPLSYDALAMAPDGARIIACGGGKIAAYSADTLVQEPCAMRLHRGGRVSAVALSGSCGEVFLAADVRVLVERFLLVDRASPEDEGGVGSVPGSLSPAFILG